MRAFISFDFDRNESHKHLFVGQSKNSQSPFHIQDWSAKCTMPENEWEKIVEDKIKKCNVVIVLVGKHMSTAKGVAKEIAMAARNRIPIFGVYVDGANKFSIPPTGLPDGRIIAWAWDTIAAALNQTRKEKAV